MLYLLDANTLIDAKRDYFQFERVPEFWAWIEYQGRIGNIKIPIEIYEEFEEARDSNGDRDELSEWASEIEIKNSLLFTEEASPELVAYVTSTGYSSTLTDDELVKIGRDPFLISYALGSPGDRVVVSTEASKPSKKRANRRVPDVCRDLGIRCINNFALLNELNFRTDWNR